MCILELLRGVERALLRSPETVPRAEGGRGKLSVRVGSRDAELIISEWV